MQTDHLKNRWMMLFAPYGEAALIQNVFDDLAKRYAQMHRYYHTLYFRQKLEKRARENLENTLLKL